MQLSPSFPWFDLELLTEQQKTATAASYTCSWRLILDTRFTNEGPTVT
jgi:hypothetical protein